MLMVACFEMTCGLRGLSEEVSILISLMSSMLMCSLGLIGFWSFVPFGLCFWLLLLLLLLSCWAESECELSEPSSDRSTGSLDVAISF